MIRLPRRANIIGAAMPKRIQMNRRAGGWRSDNPDAVIVDRRTEFGNPFPLVEDTQADRQRVVDLFEIWVRKSGARVADIKHCLRGRDLACWCGLDQPCHADVLLKIANEEYPR